MPVKTSVGIRTKKDIFFGFLIWIIGPVMLIVAFGRLVNQAPNSLINVTIITYAVTGVVTVIMSVSAVYAVYGLFLKEKSYKGHTFTGKFTILVGARNEERVVNTLLRDILAQTYQNFEVLVVCHNCIDRTAEVVNEVKDERIKPLVLKDAPLGKSVALNFGAKHATGEVIVVFDADNNIPDDFLEKLSHYFPYYDSVQTKIETKNPDFNILTKLQELEFVVFTDIFQKTRQYLGLNALLGGTGEAIKTEVLKKVGYYDEWAFSEDFAICTKLTANGYKIGWVPDTYVLDEKTPWWSDFFRQRARWTKGHLQLVPRYWKNYLLKPLDFHYLIAPVAVTSSYVTLFLFLCFSLNLPISASFFPLIVWTSPWIVWNIAIAIRLYQKRGWKGLSMYPLLFLYYYHWLAVMGYVWKMKSWAKTPHGLAKI